MAMLALRFTRQSKASNMVTTRERGVIPGCIPPTKVTRMADLIVGQINADGYCESIRRYLETPSATAYDDMMGLWAGDPARLATMPEWGKYPERNDAN